MVNATQYLNHPYRLPVIGWRHEMASYTREDALAFYRTWYAPNNAVLIVAGDIDAAELRPLAEKYYGAIPARPVPERRRLQEPPQEAPREVDLADPRVQQPSLVRSYLAPSFNAGASEHAYPLEVLAEILGGTSTSRLYRSLVIEQKLATSAGAYYRGTALDLATFRVYASPRPGVSLDELEAAVDAELTRLESEPITAAGGRAGDAADDRRGGLRPRQPVDRGAQLRRRARDRRHGRGRRGLARADRRGDRGRRSTPPRPTCSSPSARSPAGSARRRRRPRPRRRPPARRRRRAGDREIDAADRTAMASGASGAGWLGLRWRSARWARRRRARPRAKVERVVSPGGIEAYLLSEPSIPFLSLSLHFRGGAALDPVGKEGLAYMVSGLLDEGAGDLDSQAFRTELEDRAIRLSFDAGRDELHRPAQDADRASRARVRAAAPGADRAALRCRAGRADPQPDPGRAAPARRGPRLLSPPDLVRDRVPRPSLRPPGARARSRASRRSPPTICAASSRARLAKDNLVVGVAGDVTAAELGAAARPAPSATCRRRARRSSSREAAAQRRRHGDRAQGRAAEPGAVRRGGPRPRRPRLLRRLRRQPHPGRRRLHLAPDRGGAREARPRLLGLQLPLSAGPRAALARRARHRECRGRRRRSRWCAQQIAGMAAGDIDQARSSTTPRPISPARSRCA